MLAQVDTSSRKLGGKADIPEAMPTAMISVQGTVRSLASGKPVAGALVGLLPLGIETVTEDSLLAWGTANPEGQFKLNKPVPPGRYMLKAKALGHAPYSREVDIKASLGDLLIELRDVVK